jgi:predicted Zn-dependent protease
LLFAKYSYSLLKKKFKVFYRYFNKREVLQQMTTIQKGNTTTHEEEFEKWFANRDREVNVNYFWQSCKTAYLAGRQKGEEEREGNEERQEE